MCVFIFYLFSNRLFNHVCCQSPGFLCPLCSVVVNRFARSVFLAKFDPRVDPNELQLNCSSNLFRGILEHDLFFKQQTSKHSCPTRNAVEPLFSIFQFVNTCLKTPVSTQNVFMCVFIFYLFPKRLFNRVCCQSPGFLCPLFTVVVNRLAFSVFFAKIDPGLVSINCNWNVVTICIGEYLKTTYFPNNRHPNILVQQEILSNLCC